MPENKKLSTFLEFETKETKKEELGITDIVATKMGKKIAFVVCPCCGFSRKLSKNGSYYISKVKSKNKDTIKYENMLKKGELIKSERSQYYNPHKKTVFNLYNIKDEPFISIRTSIGRATGFTEVAIIKLSDIPDLPKEDKEILTELVVGLREQCQKILDHTKDIIL